MKKKCVRLIVMLTVILQLAGCWSSHEVNTLGLAVCIGIDKGKDGYVISEQVVNPRAIASKRGTDESPVTVFTAEGANIEEAITSLTAQTSRKIYSSHLRMVILSEEIAREGIGDILDYLMREHTFRTDYYFAVAKGVTAKDILTTLTPTETIPGMAMFSMLKTSHEEWAPMVATRIVELSNNIIAEGINPVINAVEIVDDMEKTDSTNVLKKSAGFEKLEFTDLGAFSNDRLVGWLDQDEAKGYSYIRGTVRHTSGSVSENGVELSFDVLKSRTKIKATVENNQPKIDVYVKSRHDIVGVKGDLDVSKIENIERINAMSEAKLRQICETAVQKAQKELKTDIFGFGERIHEKDPVYWKTVKDNWNEVFSTMPVTIHVTTELVATGDLTKPLTKKD